MEPDPSLTLHNSNTIREPAAVEDNPGHLMYSHTLHLSSGSYQHPTDTHTHMYTHNHTLLTSVEIHTLPLNCLSTYCSLYIHPLPAHTGLLSAFACMHSRKKNIFLILTICLISRFKHPFQCVIRHPNKNNRLVTLLLTTIFMEKLGELPVYLMDTDTRRKKQTKSTEIQSHGCPCFRSLAHKHTTIFFKVKCVKMCQSIMLTLGMAGGRGGDRHSNASLSLSWHLQYTHINKHAHSCAPTHQDSTQWQCLASVCHHLSLLSCNFWVIRPRCPRWLSLLCVCVCGCLARGCRVGSGVLQTTERKYPPHCTGSMHAHTQACKQTHTHTSTFMHACE